MSTSTGLVRLIMFLGQGHRCACCCLHSLSSTVDSQPTALHVEMRTCLLIPAAVLYIATKQIQPEDRRTEIERTASGTKVAQKNKARTAWCKAKHFVKRCSSAEAASCFHIPLQVYDEV